MKYDYLSKNNNFHFLKCKYKMLPIKNDQYILSDFGPYYTYYYIGWSVAMRHLVILKFLLLVHPFGREINLIFCLENESNLTLEVLYEF